MADPNRERIDKLLSRFHGTVPPHVYSKIETTLRDAAAAVGEHDTVVRLDDVNAAVTLRGKGPTLGQRLKRALGK
jgi:hypothetical protein